MRLWVITLLVVASTACSMAPGLYIDESDFAVKKLSEQERAELAGDTSVIPITAALIRDLSAQNHSEHPKENTELIKSTASYQYRVGPQDILSITVWDHPELTIPAGEFRSAEIAGHLVRNDGTIYFPYVGIVDVSNKTIEEIRLLLTKKIKKYIVKPQLDVRVVSYRSQKVHVVGEVKKVGLVPISDVPLSLLEVINIASGATEEADLQNVSLARQGTIRKFNLQALYDYGDTSQNILVRHGDIVHVPDRSKKKVFVLGEVNKPASYVMHKGRMTLAEAIGGAEGFNPNSANPSKIYVIRGEQDKAMLYWLNASSPDMLLLATNFSLESQDVVYVSTAKVSRWNRIISQILPSIQLLWTTKELLDVE